MRVGIATVVTPFISGGAEIHTNNLAAAIREAGHQADIVTMPFRFYPPDQVQRSMDVWESEDFQQMNGYNMDCVVCLKFPAYYLQHPNKVAWLIHQQRAVYDLWDTQYSGDLPHTPEGRQLRENIIRKDNHAIAECRRIFTVSRGVSDRLMHYNGIPSAPLYHPPLHAGRLYNAPAEPYIFFPSRLETLKRQDLLIQAMKHVRTPVVALLAGEGGQKEQMQKMINDLDLCDKVRIFGPVFGEDLLGYYAHALGIYFGPKNEDYGYITLEGMLASKPVITCTDSGGPLEFVIDQETGYVVEPNPELIAEAIDKLYLDQTKAAEMGRAGRARYDAMNISWSHVVSQLLGG